eukprot:217252_1
MAIVRRQHCPQIILTLLTLWILLFWLITPNIWSPLMDNESDIPIQIFEHELLGNITLNKSHLIPDPTVINTQHQNKYENHTKWNDWYFNFTAMSYFTLRREIRTEPPHQRVQYKQDISHIISWNPSHLSANAYCGSQHFHQSLTYTTRFKRGGRLRTMPYLQVHDIVFEINHKTIWIFAVNPSHKYDEDVASHKAKYEALFQHHMSEQRFMICAFNDGSTVISHQIHPSPTFPAWNVIIKCDVPDHLISFILNTRQYTNVTVSLLSTRHFPCCKETESTGIEVEITKHGRMINHNLNISNAIIEALPVCSTYEINTIDPVSNAPQLRLWHSHAHSQLKSMEYVKDDDDNYAVYSVLKRTEFEEYKYNISACVIVHGLQLDNNINTHKIVHQTAAIIHDWIEYNHAMLGIQHFIVYEHMMTPQVIETAQRIYKNRYGKDINVTRLVFDALYPYVVSGLVTYIKWNKPFQVPWTFQISQMNSCVKRFGHTGHSKYLMMMDIDEYIIPKIGYQHLTLMDLIQLTMNNETDEKIIERELTQSEILQSDAVKQKQRKYEKRKFNKNRLSQNIGYFKNIAMELYCYKLFTCEEDWGCMDGFDSVLERQRCMSYGRDTPNYQKVIVKASEVEYMFVHFVDGFVDGSTNTYYNPYTRRLKNVLCGHAKSKLVHNWTMHSIPDINHMVSKYGKYLRDSETSDKQKKIMPLYGSKHAFCDV